MTHIPEKLPSNTASSVLKLPAAPPPAESVPVIPLSDSPPPSRWKPGQKPWKPTYVHIQEIKAKVAANISSSGQATEKPKTANCLPSNPESDKTQKPATRSHSRSSRSKSYSSSYSRSRSRSYSRSRSRSYDQNHSRSSSYSQSDSESPQKKQSNKTDSLHKNWKEFYSSVKRIKNCDQYISLDSCQEATSSSDKKAQSPDINVPKRRSSSVESFKLKSEWDSESDKVSQSNSATQAKKQKQTVQPNDKKSSTLAGWNSESDSENITAAKTLTQSEKEEGEASSESEYELCSKTSEAVDALAKKIAAISSSHSEGGPERSPEPEKHKSKKKAKRKHKRKRRSENKSSSHHGKDKGKRSKRKRQTPKEVFHWQPPLEFGDDEEDDESKREKHSPNKERKDKEKPVVESSKAKDQNVTSLNQNLTREYDRGQQKTKHTEPHLQSSSRNADLSSVKEQDSLDDMDICTPEHGAEIIEPPAPHESCNNPDSTLKPTSKASDVPSKEQSPVSSTTTVGGQQGDATPGNPSGTVINFKWKPLKGISAVQKVKVPGVTLKHYQLQEHQTSSTQGVRMEIKSKSRVRPGSLFDEVRKTVRLNQRPRNQESSSEERSPSVGKTRGTSHPRSPKKSRSASRKSRSLSSRRSRSRGWSRSYSRSRSRSNSSSYSSR